MHDNHGQIDGYKADMWCFGELVMQALTGKPSFKTTKDLYMWCQTGEGYPDKLLRELQVSEGAISFLHSVMACDPAARPSAEDAQRHHWWLEPVTSRPVGGRFAPSLSRPVRKSYRSAPYVQVQSEVFDLGYRARRRRRRYGVDFALTTPFPPHTVYGHVAPPINYRNDPYEYETQVYKSPHPLSAPQLPVRLDTSLPENSRFLTASFNRAEAQRQEGNTYNIWTQDTYRSDYGPHELLDKSPREEFVRLRDVDALLREAYAQHVQKQEELAQLHDLVTLYRDKGKDDFLGYGLVRLSERHKEAERLGELLVRLRDSLIENGGREVVTFDSRLREASVQLQEVINLSRGKEGGDYTAPRSHPSSITV